MRNKLLLAMLSMSVVMPCFVNASSADGWVEGHPVSSSQYIKVLCENNPNCGIETLSCDYTGSPEFLRHKHGYIFSDVFYAGNHDRRLKNGIGGFIEPKDYNNGENPSFGRAEGIQGIANGNFVAKNGNKKIIVAGKDYQVQGHPEQRTSNSSYDFMVKYVVEYVNNPGDQQRYQHTECYPYIITWCGDGIVDTPKSQDAREAEECDPGPSGTKDLGDGRVCNSSCKKEKKQEPDPICSSQYNGRTEHTISSDHWLKSTDNLCDEGSVDGFNFSPKTGGPRIYTWNCKNGSKITNPSCTATQTWCGDGVKNGDEDCDDGLKNGTNESSCSKTCTTVGSAECGQQNKSKTYFKNGRQSNPWLTENSQGMCADGQIVGKPVMVGDHIEWICSNQNGTPQTCKAYQEWCGDGVKQENYEDCDGTDFCDFECKTITPPKDCESVFKGKLRFGETHTFSDKFKAGGKDTYLYYGPDEVKFIENHGDYGIDPKFGWTHELIKNGYKVGENTEIVVIESSPYKIISKPTIRAWDNLYLEYNIWYGDFYKTPAPAKTNLYSSKECAYYEISWCGDGVLDEDYGEECDPDVEPWKDDGTCNPETCTVKSQGKLKTTKEVVVPANKVIKNTGDQISWKVTVEAVGGNVEMKRITDTLPNELVYSGYKINSIPNGITIGEPKISGNDIRWEVKGTLKSGDKIELVLDTKVIKMPASQQTVKNVACAIPEEGDKDCGTGQTTSLRIEKYILDGNKEVKTKNVKIGDEIIYKIKFGNNGDAAATVTSIKDFLPKNVKYKSSEIHIERTANHSSGTQQGDEQFKGYKIVDGVYIDIYGGLTLQPGDRGYIIIKAEVLSDNLDNRTNFACIYLDNEVVDCDDATHTFTEETMSCIPTLSPSSFSDVCSSDTSSFSTTVTCKSSRESDIEILCDGVVVKTGHASQLTGTCSAATNNIDHKAQCKINGSLTGTDGKSCEASFRRNTKSCGGGSSCFVAGTQVLMADGSYKNIEDVEIGEYVMGEKGIGNKVIGYDRPILGENRKLWSINGGEYFVSDEHPFKTIDGWKAIDSTMAQAEILNAIANKWLVSDDSTEELINITQLEEGNTLITSTGTTTITSLRSNKSDPNTQLYNFMLSGDNTYYANGYLVHNKGGGGSPYCDKLEPKGNNLVCTASKEAYFRIDCDGKLIGDLDGQDEKVSSIKYSDYKNCERVTCYVSATKSNDRNGSKCVRENEIEESPSIPQGCFNVNAGQFSIEEGEIMPFYWNLNNLNNKAFGGNTSKDNYTEIKGENYDAVNIYSSKDGVECDEDGKIATNSMVCTFNIYDGQEYHKGVQNGVAKNNPLYTIEGPCLASSPVIEKNNLIKARYSAMTGTYCNNSNSTDCVFYYGDSSSSAVLPTAVYYIENFGSGASVGVDAGSFKNNKLNFIDTWDLAGKPENKKSYGEYKIELSSVKYLQCEDGTWQKKEPVLNPPCHNDFVLTNSYTVQKTPSGNLTASMKELHKYYNYSGTMTFDTLLNAIQSTTYKPNDNVNGAMDKFINKYKKLAVTVDISKSNLLKGGNATVSKVPGKSIYFVSGSITINGSKQNIDTPFTIVQTTGNATINGNVGHNMMLLTNGNIIFQGGCTSDQTVKGIFYARGNLSRSGVGKNNSIKSDTWCTYGGLHVKGVLIGNNFNNLMKTSRSNLNMRFKAKGAEDEIKNQRRRYLMDGASVVIEYSPSIFTKSTMPPGAEYFTTALSIYKN